MTTKVATSRVAREVTNQNGRKRSAVAKTAPGLSKDKAKRRKHNAFEKDRLVRIAEGYDKLNDVLPAYNMKHKNEKMTTFNLVHYGANFIKLLLLALKYRIPLDSSAFQKGVAFLKQAMDSRWTDDLFVNSALDDLFKSSREYEIICLVPQHDPICDSDVIEIGTPSTHSVSDASHQTLDHPTHAPLHPETASDDIIIPNVNHEIQCDVRRPAVLHNAPAWAKLSTPAVGRQLHVDPPGRAPVTLNTPTAPYAFQFRQRTRRETAHCHKESSDSKQPLLSAPANHPGGDISDIPSCLPVGDQQAKAGHIGQRQTSNLTNMTGKAFGSSQNLQGRRVLSKHRSRQLTLHQRRGSTTGPTNRSQKAISKCVTSTP